MNKINSNVFILAGESSGDIHSAKLVKDLKLLNPDFKFYAVGGGNLKNAGAELLFDYKEINFIGFSAIIKNYFSLKRKLVDVINFIKHFNPQIIILTDFPGFNLKLAKELRKFYTGKIYYYITPQVWAWHRGRVNSIKKYFDKCFVIFPFEKTFFEKFNIESHYIGHPLVISISKFLRSTTKIKNPKFTITLMPGTREEEFNKIFPTMLEYVKKLSTKDNFNFNLLISDNINDMSLIDKCKSAGINILSSKDNYEVIYNSDFVITKFGTSTLECSLLGIPFCAVYRTNFINYFIAKLLIKINYVALVNIIFNEEIVKEFIQQNFTVNNLIEETNKVYNDIEYRNKMINKFKPLYEYFGSEVIKENAAEIIFTDYKESI